MRFVKCKDCGKDECVSVDMCEPWICADCLELHKMVNAKDFEREFFESLEADA